MDNVVKKEIIKEYELKRILANKNVENKINEVKNKLPELKVLKDKQNMLSVELLKASMISNKVDKEVKELNIKVKINEINFKIDTLLKEKGYSTSYFKPQYECEKCSDTGYVNNVECICFKQKLLDTTFKQYNMNKLNEENFNTFTDKYYSDEIKESYKSKKTPKENINNIFNISKKFCDNLESDKELNLLFVGNTGLGKTFLSNSIAYEVIKNGYTAIYQTSSNLMDLIIKYKFAFNKTKEQDDTYNRLLESDLLIIDDLGTETINNMKFTELFNILNTRILNNKKMIISTNLSLEKLYELYDERIVSRLIGDFRICRFYGEDIRLKKKMSNKNK